MFAKGVLKFTKPRVPHMTLFYCKSYSCRRSGGLEGVDFRVAGEVPVAEGLQGEGVVCKVEQSVEVLLIGFEVGGAMGRS